MAVHSSVGPLASILTKAIGAIPPAVRQGMYENHLPSQYEKAISPVSVRWLIAITVFLILILVFWIWTLVREIQGREAAEKEREESRQKFEQLFAGAPMPLALIDFDGCILAVNQRWSAVFGFQDTCITHVSDWYEQVYPDSAYPKPSENNGMIRLVPLRQQKAA
jgi:PAS domain-containing protein